MYHMHPLQTVFKLTLNIINHIVILCLLKIPGMGAIQNLPRKNVRP